MGFRAAIGPGVADLWHDEHGVLVRQADAGRLLAGAREAIERYDGAAGQLRQLGQLEVCQLSDLVLVDITGLHHLDTDHPVPALGLHARAADITTVIVAGRVVIDGGQLTGLDEAALAAQAHDALTAAAAG